MARPSVLEDAARDVRHAARVLRRSPGFTAAALITLSLGIGATSAVFAVLRGVMLKPLPYESPARIVAIWETVRGGTARNVIAPANFAEWRERTRTLEDLAMVGPAAATMVVNGQPDRIAGLTFSAAGFRTLGVRPVLGRVYNEAEDRGNASVLVLSYEFWQGRLGGRGDVLGLAIPTDGRPRAVVGVMPAGFTVAGQRASFLVPDGRTSDQLRGVHGRESSYAIARLRDRVTFDQAAGEMRTIFADLEREAPARNASRTVILLPIQEQMVGDLRPAAYALTGAVVLVLLVACANVANLLLARSAARELEVNVRTALGASRARVMRQLLTEHLLLASAGGIGGLALAALGQRGLLALVGDRIPIPRLDQVGLDAPVVGFTVAVALAAGVLVGLVPAFVSTAHAREATRDAGRHGGGRRLHRVLRALVVAEVALSLVLLAGAGLLMRSFIKLQNVDPGFRTAGVLTASVQLPVTRYDFARSDSFFNELRSRVGALPAVQSVGGASCMPVPFPCIGTSFWRSDREKPPPGQLPSGQVRPVTPGFFKAMGIAQLAGRDFSDADTASAPPVAIVSQEVVRQQFPDGSPLSRRLRIGVDHASGAADVEWTIVGVVGDIRSSLDGPVRQAIFIPRTDRPGANLTLFVRTARDPLSLAASVTSAVHAMEPEAPVAVRTLEDVVGGTIARPRAISIVVATFALVALVLAAVGVYGVMAYSVKARTQEIGVRMALGASAGSVLRMILGQALRLVLVGVAAGLGAAMLFTRLLERLLFQVEPLDGWTFGLTALVLLATATIASLLPAVRGMRMAPMEALRTIR